MAEGDKLTVATREGLKQRLGLLAWRFLELEQRVGSDEDGARRSLSEAVDQHNAIVHLFGLSEDLEVHFDEAHEEEGD